jgi:hypothetical protein
MDQRFYPALESPSVLPRLAAALLLATSLRACATYEYEHEFWLRVDGSGSVRVTGRLPLWPAFKGLGRADDPEGTAAREAARAAFEASGLHVRRVKVTHRGGRPYLFVAADFADVNRIGGTPAFPDLRISLTRTGERLVLAGNWGRPAAASQPPAPDADGLIAVRFHLPSKIYEHRNAALGVERGNILTWRQDVTAALEGRPLEFGAVVDPRSILWSTVGLFAAAIVGALAILAAAIALVARTGRRRVPRGTGEG